MPPPGSSQGQAEQEPRWKRGAHLVDGTIGEALGRLYVEKYYPPAARQRMSRIARAMSIIGTG